MFIDSVNLLLILAGFVVGAFVHKLISDKKEKVIIPPTPPPKTKKKKVTKKKR